MCAKYTKSVKSITITDEFVCILYDFVIRDFKEIYIVLTCKTTKGKLNIYTEVNLPVL